MKHWAIQSLETIFVDQELLYDTLLELTKMISRLDEIDLVHSSLLQCNESKYG